MGAAARLGQLRKQIEDLVRKSPGRNRGGSPPSHHADRGREAADPHQIPAPGWKDVLWRTWQDLSDKNLFLVAGGVTYSALLALFPGLAALVSIYGLLLDPAQIEQDVASLAGVLPEQTRAMLQQELHQLASASNGALGISAIVGLLFALWTASRGMSGLITALNIAYGEKEQRSFLKFNLLALGLTLGMLLGGIVGILLVAVLPAVVTTIGPSSITKWLLLILEWPLLMAFMMAGLAVLYRYGPDRDEPQWRWVSPGTVTATVLWIIGSIGFSAYVANFSGYDKTYGTLGGAIVLLTWLYLSSLIVLIGADINAQSERQTRKDTTRGTPQPMGTRGAQAADTLGASADEKDGR